MNTQSVILRSERRYGRRVPPRQLGRVLELLPGAVGQSLRMAVERRSKAPGKHPTWLSQAADIRFVGHDGNDETILYFETPTLGEAAPGLYEQREIWPTRPEPTDTGFDILADVLSDVAARNADSDRFDRPLLDSISRFHKALDNAFDEMSISTQRHSDSQAAVVTPSVVEIARSLYTNTPMPQRVRIIGKLDMLRASTQSFGVILDDGEEVRGVLSESGVEKLTSLLNHRVLVIGEAVYRPSGRLLRIDAVDVSATTDDGKFFSAIPTPVRQQFDIRDVLREQPHKLGVAGIIGKWPGDETDEEIEQALRELS